VALPAPALLTPEEYLEFEMKSQEKHELYDGYLIAMAGAQVPHRRIQTNLIVALGNMFKAKDRNCIPYASDTRVYVSQSRYFYPDVTVFCGKAVEDKWDNALNPDVVIEILSDSTASFDKNEKAAAYRQMPELKQLVLIDSREKHITIYVRNAEGAWVETQHDAEAKQVRIADEDISLSEIYESAL